MNKLTNNQKLIISALVGFIIGAGAVWVYSVATPAAVPEEEVSAEEGNLSDEAENFASQTPAAPEVRTAITDNVSVAAQAAGSSVRFAATLSAPGWVVVHEDRDGAVGNALGARWLAAGTAAEAVELLRDTVSGQTYHVLLYSDDGDREFELYTDPRVTDISGEAIAASFIAQ